MFALQCCINIPYRFVINFHTRLVPKKNQFHGSIGQSNRVTSILLTASVTARPNGIAGVLSVHQSQRTQGVRVPQFGR